MHSICGGWAKRARECLASLRRSGITALRPLLAREDPPLASLLPLLPLQARCSSPTGGSSSPVRARRFPQPLWTTRCDVRRRRADRCGLPRQRHGAALSGAASRWRSAVAGGRGSRTSGVPGTPGCAAGSGPGCTALRRQGRSVARAEGPRHRRPRLRHEAHRRGDASAASRPRTARARVVIKVGLSAQPPADRSVQRLIPRRRWTAPASRWAARPCSGPPSVRQRARTDAAPCLTTPPPKGHSRKAPAPLRSARAADSCRPQPP